MTYESFSTLMREVDKSLVKLSEELRLNGLPDQMASQASTEIHAIRNTLATIGVIAKTEGVDQYYED